jgi:hypothetical protein
MAVWSPAKWFTAYNILDIYSILLKIARIGTQNGAFFAE